VTADVSETLDVPDVSEDLEMLLDAIEVPEVAEWPE
jgi:hypothetical protein